MAKSKFSITALIGVDSSLMSRGLGKATRKMTQWAKTSMAKLKAAVVAGVAVAGAALGAFAVKSVKEFGSFEKGMQEVFTLLPNMSKDAMDAMSQDVLNLSNKMGVLPEEIVPSLYQALSAGVPAGNVFDFLEVSIKGAKAGVATTAESVDLLSSVVNAYGKENISAAKASDIIFTTIKAGKTTFAELSAAMYNVAPAAANAGVSFEDVGSAIAAMTAQGVPTKVATTQIRQAILAMMAPNKAMTQVFQNSGMAAEDLANVMKQPGGLVKALQMVQTASKGNSVDLKMMLGSVEALQASMVLTANGGQAFAGIMGQMGAAAGATQTAYGVMDKGILRSFEKIKAALKVTMINMGKSLAPFVQAAVPTIMKIIGMIQAIPWTKIMQGFARVWLIGIKPYADAVMKMLKNLPWHLLIDTLLPIASMVIKTIQNLGSAIIRLGPMIIPGLRALAGYFSFLMLRFFILSKLIKEFAPDIAQIFRAVFQVAAKAFEFFINPSAQKFKELVDLIKSRFGNLAKSIGDFMGTVKEFLATNFKIIAAGIIAAFGKVLGGVWAQIKDFLAGQNLIEREVNAFKEVWQNLKAEVVPALADLKNAVAELFSGVSAAFSGVEVSAKNQKSAMDLLVGMIALVIRGFTGFVKTLGFLTIAFMRLWTVGAKIYKDLLPLLKVGIAAVLIVVGLLTAAWATQVAAGALLMAVIGKLVQGFVGLLKYLQPVYEALKILAKILGSVFKAFFMVAKSVFAAGFQELGNFIKSFVEKFKEYISAISGFWKDAFTIIWNIAKNALEPVFKLFDFLKKKVYDVLFGGTVTKDFKKAFEFIGNIVSTVIGAIIAAFERMKNIASGIFGGIFKLAEKAIGFASKIFKGAGGALGSIVGKVVGGGGAPAGAQVRGSGGTINTSTLQTSLRPIVEKLTSMDITLKSIDRKLSGKFVNQ